MLSNLKRSHLLMESCNICSTATMGKMFLNSHIKSNTKVVLYHRHTYSFRLWYPNTQICNKCRVPATNTVQLPTLCLYCFLSLSPSYSRSLSLLFSLPLFLPSGCSRLSFLFPSLFLLSPLSSSHLYSSFPSSSLSPFPLLTPSPSPDCPISPSA